jgi:soluble lytic murein transglycosylase-like protein
MVLGITSSPETQAVMSSGTIDRNAPESLFSKLEKQNGLPAGLLSSIYSAESSRGKNLVSPKGALGPFQFMPVTAAQYGLQGSDVFDLNKSAGAAAKYLHDLMTMFNGNLQDAVAAYNWGPGNVMRKGLSSMPKETENYLRRVLGGAHPGARFGGSTAAKANTTTNDVHIGSITVQTKATDANGVARGMQKALIGNPLIRNSVTVLA